MEILETLEPFVLSLALGLMMGLERERRGGTNAGLRTFGLTGVAGTAVALLAQKTGSAWLLPVVAASLVAMMISADHHKDDQDEGPDATTTVALLLCFFYGAMLWHGYHQATVALALTTTALLYFKAELHDASRRLTRQDIVSFLQFALITFVVLPVLPDEGYGPYDKLNPYKIWLMVVLTSGLSLAGYATLRLTPPTGAVPVLGLLGGLVSSTATTLVFARQVRGDARQADTAAVIITIANLIVPVRIGVLCAVVAPAGLPVLAPILGAGLVAGALPPLRGWLAMRNSKAAAPDLDNPVDLRQALMFGAIFAAVLMVSAAFHEQAGSLGVYAVAAISGLADMDAIAISTFNLLGSGELTAAQGAIAVVIALASNMAFKATLVITIAGRNTAGRVIVSFLAQLAGLVAAAWVVT